MTRNSRPRYRAIAIILLLNTWLVLCICHGISAQTSSSGEQEDRTKEQRFETFRKELLKSIDAHIAKLEKSMSSELHSRYALIAASVRGPMVVRLEQIRDQFMKELDQEPQRTTIRKDLATDDSIPHQVKTYFQKADGKLTEQYNKSQVELANLLGTSLLDPTMETIIKYIAGGGFCLLTVGIILMIFMTSYRDEKKTMQLDRETIYLSITLAIIYLIFLLSILDYLAKQRIQGYLAIGFVSMVILYFGSRVVEALYNFTSGFTFIKTFTDGTKEKIKNYEHSNVIDRINKLNSTLTNTLENLTDVISQIQKRENEGWGFIEGNIRFANNQTDKTGVKVTLESTSGEFPTDKDGYFLIPDIRPGIYNLKAEKTGFKSHSERVKVPFRGKAQPDITMVPL